MKLRLPAALRDRIKDAAEANGRSMNAEIVGALARAYPKTGNATDLLRDIFGLVVFNQNKLDDDDLAVFEEAFEALQTEINRLQRIENTERLDD